MAQAARATLESLLRTRKLDVTLTSTACHGVTDEALTSTGLVSLDNALGGGLRRGHLSEIVGAPATGRTTLLCGLLAAATSRGEIVAVVDTHDRFDPIAAAHAGVDLPKVLWIRETGDAARAVKAMNLVLQAGGFGVVVLDVADIGRAAARQFPFTTWMRLARVIEGSQTVALLLAAEHLGRSPGGVTIALDAVDRSTRGRWTGAADRARLLRGINVTPRVVAARSPVSI
jgi:hypothetical protein